jgi:hypothetical protein
MSEARRAGPGRLPAYGLRSLWLLLGGTLAADAALIAAPWLEARAVAIWVLAGALPGILSARLLVTEGASSLSRALIAAGLAYVWAILGTLLLHYLPGPLSRVPILSAYNLAIAGLGVLTLTTSRGTDIVRGDPSRTTLLALGAAVLVVAVPRLLFLGYSEFQGDEVAVMSKAAAVVQGRDDALFLHKKGPAEILLPALVYAVSQRMTEGVARLPFALAGVAGLAALYEIARHARSPRAGAWPLGLAAVNGFFVAFGRIVQYQSLVLLMSALALLCALQYADRGRREDLWLCALFLAVGLLAHTDAALAVPACVGIILWAQPGERAPFREAMRAMAGPVAIGAAILALFYVPFVLHSHFGATQDYLVGRLGTPPVNNLGHIVTIGSAYNAIYLLALLGAALALSGVARLSASVRHRAARWALAGGSVSLMALALVAPERWQVAGRDLTALAFLPPLAGLFLARDRGAAWLGALLWFAVPLIAYTFIVEDPRTHVYALFPGASLLVGIELAALRRRLRRWALPAEILTGLVLLVAMAYVGVAFIDHTPEYERTYPAHRQTLFWTPFGDTFPEKGLFGFPYRAGWKLVGALYGQGVLRGDLGSNEEEHIVAWYTRGQPTCNANPRYYALATNVQDVQPVSEEAIARDYALVGRVWVGDEVKLRLYERRPAQLPYREYDADDYVPWFDRHASGPYYSTGLPAADPLAGVQHRSTLRLGSDIEFLGYSVNTRTLGPGEPLVVTLYWRARAPMTERYTAFVHIEDPGVVWAQKDTPPVCGTWPTDRWQVGGVVEDTYVLVPSEDTPAGQHLLVAGMYHPATGERLAVLNSGGYPVSTILDLGTVEYLPASGD